MKTTKVKKKHIKQHVYIIKTQDNEVLIEKRMQKLLNNMWEFPMYEAEAKHQINSILNTNIQFSEQPAYKLKHQFTHLTWDIEVYLADQEINNKDEISLPNNMKWMNLDEKEDYNFPVSMTKIYKFLLSH